MCFAGAKWKREVVPDHKFDFIDVREFHDGGCLTRLRYSWIYVLVIKSFLVYVSDLYTAIAMLASNRWSGSILSQAGAQDSKTVQIPFSIGKWIFTGCIIFSFLLLAWEARKARNIIRSHDISYAYTNVMANNYYSMKSYDHFCFFCQINNERKKKDDMAFFIFFTFKGWKRLLLADAPRQVINGLTLYSFGKAFNFTTDISKYIDGSVVRAGILITMIFTVVVWIGSFILLVIAGFMYIPLLCYIQGNLKEYCCHKVDKRIAELMKKKTRKRLLKEAALARKEALGDYSHLKDKKGNLRAKPMAQPTLPQIDLDEDYHAGSEISFREKGPYQEQAGYTSQSHMYPPIPPSNQWGKYDAAPQPYHYAGSDVGYEPSLHSSDRLVTTNDNPYEQQFYSAPSMQPAPSYHSQSSSTDLLQRPWEHPSMPPNPHYAGSEINDKPSGYPDEYERADQVQEEYQPVSRERLYERTQTQQQPDPYAGYTSHGPSQTQTDGRPASDFMDFGHYYERSDSKQQDYGS